MVVNPLGFLLLAGALIAAFILFIVFVLVPLFRGIGSRITGFFHALGWLVSHIAEFVGGMISDIVRLLGSILALVVLAVLVPANVIIGRWSAAGHFTDALKRELAVAGGCIYRFCLRRPLKLFWLHGLLEGLEERVPEAMFAAPTADTPGKRTGQFDGYTIVGSLRGGGSGGKLYIARPDDAKRARLTGHPDLVVIKSFTLTEGSSLPQIVRESRALECAKQLGHVLEHGMDVHRFFYVMPYHPGDHLGIIARQLHAQSDGKGLARRQLGEVCGYMRDVLATLRVYHDGGFWHKDIKPENIIVHGGRAHVVDLGLITPLKSAMTLTTHGTEYFRDPEMVRKALRGVKVHQVNGVKFDIYAAGAVLYFVLENTFPAHGGLSRFTRNSPESLRWIVKRAMAEYNQRYETVEMMLADLEVVTNADDPFAVKLSALPSMKGGAQVEEDIDVTITSESPQAEQVAAAGSPVPTMSPRRTAVPAVAGVAGASAYRAESAEEQRRPRLRVTDWFTGKYAVQDPGSAVRGGYVQDHHDERDDASAEIFAGMFSGNKEEWKQQKKHLKAQAKLLKKQLKSDAKQLKKDMRGGADYVRRSAQQQIAAARARARDIQARAAKRRPSVAMERQPSPGVVVTTLIVLALLFVAIWNWPPLNFSDFPGVKVTRNASTTATITQSPAPVADKRGLPVLTVLDVDAELQSAVYAHGQYRNTVEKWGQDGYHVLSGVGPDQDDLRELIQQWREQPTGTAGESLENIFAEHDLYGFLVIRAKTGQGGEIDEVTGSIIRSSAPQAADRRWPHVTADLIDLPPNELPFLLVNDHPARTDRHVSSRIAHQLNVYGLRGWNITADDDLEVTVRKALPAGGPASLRADSPLPDRVRSVLEGSGYGGLVIITAPAGDAPTRERIAVTTIAID